MTKNQEGTNQNVRIWRRDEFKCAYCDLDMSTSRNSELLVSDHIDPRTKIKYPPGDYGKEHDKEKITACIPCNSYKHGFQPPDDCLTRDEKIQAAREYVRDKREKWFRYFSEINSEKQREDWFKFWQEI